MGGRCCCCRTAYPIGTLIVYDKLIHGTVINGHQTTVKPVGNEEQW
jgi:hypothetical protein